MVHKNEVKTRNEKYAKIYHEVHGVHDSFLFFIYDVFAQDFLWNTGETEVEIQTEIQENAGPRLALLGLGQTHGSAGPRVAPLALSLLCMVCLDVVCCVRYVLLPHTGLLPVVLFKDIWKQNKTLPVLKTGEFIFY